MKILLINPPGWQAGSVSLGLGYLAAILIKDGHEVKVLDETGKTLATESMARKAFEFKADIIGFHCKTAQANACSRISSAIKKVYPSATHVIGGPHITLCYEEYLKDNPDFSFGFIGEADINFLEFCRRIEQGKSVEDIPGLAYRKDGRIIGVERELIIDLDELPRPNFDVIENFSWVDFRYPLLTSRGCPYKCNFCSVPLISSKRFRTRSPADCIDELARVTREKGITCFEILDDNLTLNMKRAKEFCNALIESKLNLSWYCHNGIRADRLDQELADLMAKAGCTSIAFGIESGDQEVFRRVIKGEELQHIVDAINMTKKAGMKTVGYFIIGLPGDNLQAVKTTIKFQRTLDLDHHVYGIFIPYPGTSGREDVLREGKIIRDIKETNHFSDRPQISIEYPYFTRAEIEEAYYLATAGELADFMESWGVQGAMDNVLYVETDPATNGYRRFGCLVSGNLDLFVNSAYDGSFEPDMKGKRVREVHAFERSPDRFAMALQMLRQFRTLCQKEYNLALWPIRWRHSRILVAAALCAFIVLVRPKHIVLYDFDSSRFLELSWRNLKFRRLFLDYLKRRILGESAGGSLWWTLSLLPARMLKLVGKVFKFVAGEILVRTLYASFCIYLGWRKAPPEPSSS
jgi:radical SAM superfamily enzyme YgiQ (UPF0313 family)